MTVTFAPASDRTPIPLALGDLAFLDTPRGLVPVKIITAGVVAYSGSYPGDAYMTWQVTADRPGYHRGESACVWLSTMNRYNLLPRQSVHRSKIVNNWHWLIDNERLNVFDY